MPADMQQHISMPCVPSYDQFRPPQPAEGQRKGKVRSFFPSFVDRAIFRTKPATHRDTAESHPEVDPATNVDSLATKSRMLRHLPTQLNRTKTQKPRTVNRGLGTSLVAVNKERKATPQALDKAQRRNCATEEQLNLDPKAMQSEMSEIIRAYDSKLRDMNELNMRQGAQVIKLQSKLFDQDEHIALLESLEISNPLVETIARKINSRNLNSASPAITGSQGRVMEVQAIAEHRSECQSSEPVTVVKRNSMTKQEPERREEPAKRQCNIAHNASKRRNLKDDDPFASEPNLAPHRRIRNVLADARDKTLATISELKDVRRKKDEQQPSQTCQGHQAEFRDIRGLLADARKRGATTQATTSETKDVNRNKDEQRPSQACYGHQAEFAAYQDQIAALTSERDTLSRELKRSTRMAHSNAVLLNSVELEAQRLLSEHDALIAEHQQEKVRSQQQIRELQTQLEDIAASASRARERYETEHKQLLEVEEQLKLERIQLARTHRDHVDEMIVLLKKNAGQANLIETLDKDLAEQRTTLHKAHPQPDLANYAQATMKRKVRKYLRLS
jgi:predicted nucleic acid-binding protein